ncbi:hypothetical protein F53441_6507 [Fusarium austroafricanum]|uniref:Uncharacterized protein n=1 Tax=Fusarium austroafricanum TaxID=2364996 RepID=A0A8H4KIK6_9HYPO|nr:hypothetical protein F53441_6507 [Fusarium austroafricanum]
MATEREHTTAGAETAPEGTTKATANQDHDAPAADAQSDHASSDDHVRDEKPAPGPTKWQKVKRHFWRFKWWYLLALIILLAILLPLLFTVIIPAIVQNILNGQNLEITGGALQVLSPSEVNMSITTSLDTPIPAVLKPVDLYLYSKETTSASSFFKLHLPEKHLNHKTSVVITNQTLQVTNITELTKWFNVFFDKPKVDLSLEGHPEIALGALHYHRTLKKTIQIPSLTYLDGFALTDLNFDLNTNRTSKFNMKGMLNIPNSGVLRLGLGNLTFNVMSGDINLGLIHLWDLQLWPGNNSVPFEGNFYFDELVPNLSEILDAQKGPLGNGYVEFNATGNTTIANGKHIPYIEGVLNYKHIRFTCPVITLLGDVIGGFLDASKTSKGSLLDVFGGAVGNKTLFEHLLGHWDQDGQGGSSNKTARGLMERSKKTVPGSWMWNLVKLGLTRKGL